MHPLSGSQISPNSGITGVPAADNTPLKSKAGLKEPNAPRTGGFQRPSGRRFGLMVATAVTAAILATGLPTGNGAALAQTTDTAATEQQAPINDVRHIEGNVKVMPDGSYVLNIESDDGVSWYDGKRYNQVFLGSADSDVATRFTPGDALIFDGRTVPRDDGKGGLRLEFLQTESLERTPYDSVRHIEGEVKKDADGNYWLNVSSDDGMVEYNDHQYSAVFLAEADSAAGKRFQEGDVLSFDGTTIPRADGDGDVRLEFLEAESLQRTPYLGSAPDARAEQPRWDGRAFREGRQPVNEIQTACANDVCDIVVLNRAGTMAFSGQIPTDRASFDGDAGFVRHEVTDYLAGGPSFDVKEGQVAHPDTGVLLQELSTKNDGNGNLASGWFLHQGENYNTLVHLNFETDANTATADKTIALDSDPGAPLDDLKKN